MSLSWVPYFMCSFSVRQLSPDTSIHSDNTIAARALFGFRFSSTSLSSPTANHHFPYLVLLVPGEFSPGVSRSLSILSPYSMLPKGFASCGFRVGFLAGKNVKASKKLGPNLQKELSWQNLLLSCFAAMTSWVI